MFRKAWRRLREFASLVGRVGKRVAYCVVGIAPMLASSTTDFSELMSLLQSVLPILIFVSIISAILGALAGLGRRRS